MTSRSAAPIGSVRRWRRGAILLAVALISALISAQPASAAQQQNANEDVYWNFHGQSGFWNIDQQVQVSQKATSTFWAMQWGFSSAPNDPGYLGMQTNGNRANGTTGETAIFSLWNANAATGSCRTFGGEGTGYSCAIPYTITAKTYYRYRVWRLNADAGGQWWGAWIENISTGVDTPIGALRVAASKTLMTTPLNFVEYFGTAVSCDKVPVSVALFTQPAANQQSAGVYQYGSVYDSWNRGSCTGGTVQVVNLGWTNAAKATMGGKI